MGIVQTDPCQSCRYPIAARGTDQPRFSFSSKAVSAASPALQGAKAPPVPAVAGTTAFVKRTRSQPRPWGCSRGLGYDPNKQKQRFPATPGTAVSSLCGNKDTACYNGDTPQKGGDDRPMQRFTPKLQWEGTGLPRHCLSCYARLRKLSAGPPIAAFDLRRLRSGQHRTLVSHSKLNRWWAAAGAG